MSKKNTSGSVKVTKGGKGLPKPAAPETGPKTSKRPTKDQTSR